MGLLDIAKAKAMFGSGGGGGGESDFSTAEVVITNNSTEKAFDMYCPFVSEGEEDDVEWHFAYGRVFLTPGESLTFKVILYKGEADCDSTDMVSLQSTVTGDIEEDHGGFIITGNGTITIADAV